MSQHDSARSKLEATEITLKLTVGQIDTLRYAARTLAKKNRKESQRSKLEYVERHLVLAEKYERMVTTLSGILRHRLGEQDFHELEIGYLNQRPAETREQR